MCQIIIAFRILHFCKLICHVFKKLVKNITITVHYIIRRELYWRIKQSKSLEYVSFQLVLVLLLLVL